MNKGTLSQTICSSVSHENVSDLMSPLMLHKYKNNTFT